MGPAPVLTHCNNSHEFLPFSKLHCLTRLWAQMRAMPPSPCWGGRFWMRAPVSVHHRLPAMQALTPFPSWPQLTLPVPQSHTTGLCNHPLPLKASPGLGSHIPPTQLALPNPEQWACQAHAIPPLHEHRHVESTYVCPLRKGNKAKEKSMAF